MIRIRIGNEERDLVDADAQWINQQVNRRRTDRQNVCVMVTINEDNMNLLLATPTCGAGKGGGRLPNPQEKEILDLWNQRGLNREDFTGGNLVAFLKQLDRIL
jgi:hypothetical protein